MLMTQKHFILCKNGWSSISRAAYQLPFIISHIFRRARSMQSGSAANLEVLNVSHHQHECSIIIMAWKKTKQKQRMLNGSNPRFRLPPKSNQLVFGGFRAKYICCFFSNLANNLTNRDGGKTWLPSGFTSRINQTAAERRHRKHPWSRPAEGCWEI